MADDRNYHVIPLADLIEHDTEHFDECVCGPDVEFMDNGTRVITHHSLDGRELHEPDYAR